MRISLLAIVAVVAWAQPHGAIEGKVVDAVTGAPLRKAYVLVSRFGPGQPRALTTDANGFFLVDELEAGSYQLRVERSGYLGGFSMQVRADVKAGETTRDIVVKLQPQAIITGRVRDEDGDPIPNTTVAWVRRTWVKGRRSLQVARSVQTNDLGEYRLTGLGAGKYILRANVGANTMFGQVVRSISGAGYAETYYPGVSDPGAAMALEVAAGAVRSGVDFTLRPERIYRIQGRVKNLAAPGARVLVSATRADRSEASSNGILTDGSFQLYVAPGSYLVIAQCNTGSVSHLERLPVQVSDREVDLIDLTILPSVTLTGQVRSAGGEPVKFEGEIGLEAMLSKPDEGWSSDRRADGSIVFENIPPGDYRIGYAEWPQGYYLKSVLLGQDDVLSGGLRVSGAGQRLDFVLETTRAEIRGRVVDSAGQPVAAGIALLPDGVDRRHHRVTSGSGNDGAFVIHSIAPGSYHLVAIERMDLAALDDPEYLRSVRDKLVAVKITAESKETIDLKVISQAELER